MDKSLDRNDHWNLLHEVIVNDSTRGAMTISMPGTASSLDRHEWVKHGTCYSETPEEYYSESLMLLDQINNSSVRDLYANNIGQNITANEIRSKFDEAFGRGAGAKVNVTCTGRLITELTINLKGEINTDSRIADLMKNSPTARLSCNGGTIDPVGF
jgi:ribonuclease T2